MSLLRFHQRVVGNASHHFRCCRRSCSSYYEEGKLDSASSSSGHARLPETELFNNLIAASRRTRFVPPTGYTQEESFRQLNELLQAEQEVPESIRLGDLLLISNTLVCNDSLSVLTKEELVEFVIGKVRQRARLPNIFTLLQYLRFTNLSATKLQSLQAIVLTLERSPEVKVSELIELVNLLLAMRIPQTHPEGDVSELIAVIRNKLRVASARDPDALSGKVKSNAYRLSEYFFRSFVGDTSLAPQLRDELLALIGDVMKGRNCASPEILRSLLELGMKYKESREKDMAILTAQLVRDTQLPRWLSVRGLFSSDPEAASMLDDLSSYTGVSLLLEAADQPIAASSGETVSFSLRDTLSGKSRALDQLFVRLENSHNSRPLYSSRTGFYLYFSSSTGCWQVGKNIERDLVRDAYIRTDPQDVPLGQTGWKVFSNGKFVESKRVMESGKSSRRRPAVFKTRKESIASESVALGVAEPKASPVESNDSDSDMAARWEQAISVCEAIKASEPVDQEKDDPRLKELESLVSDLKQRIDDLQSRIEKSSVQPSSLRKMADSLVAAIDYLGERGRADMIPSGKVPDFDAYRKEYLDRVRLETQSKMVARKLRNLELV